MISAPLDKQFIRNWTKITEELKIKCRQAGFDEVWAGCSDDKRVKYLVKLFGFEKVKEVTVDGSVWSVVRMCF